MWLPFFIEPDDQELCQWSYGQWSRCSVTCGEGSQSRIKFLEKVTAEAADSRDVDNAGCEADAIEEARPCFGPPCKGNKIRFWLLSPTWLITILRSAMFESLSF